jgi:hypothetical protein
MGPACPGDYQEKADRARSRKGARGGLADKLAAFQ